MTRELYNNQGGFLADSMNATQTFIQFGEIPDFQTLTTGETITIALDSGLPSYEIVHLTAFTEGASGGTIVRQAEDQVNWPQVPHQLNPTGNPPTGTWAMVTTADDFTAASSIWFNVTDFGATGNGVTDDTSAILAAIAAAVANGNGSTVYFPAGTYVTSLPLVLQSCIVLRGDRGANPSGDASNQGSVIKPSAAWTNPQWHTINGDHQDGVVMIIENNPTGVPTAATGITMFDLWIDGINLASAVSPYTAVDGICTYGRVTACEFERVGISFCTGNGFAGYEDNTNNENSDGFYFFMMGVFKNAGHGFFGHFNDSHWLTIQAAANGFPNTSGYTPSADGFNLSGQVTLTDCRASQNRYGFQITPPNPGDVNSTILLSNCQTQINNIYGIYIAGNGNYSDPVNIDNFASNGDGIASTNWGTNSAAVPGSGTGQSTAGIFISGYCTVNISNSNVTCYQGAALAGPPTSNVVYPNYGIKVDSVNNVGLAVVTVDGGFYNCASFTDTFPGHAFFNNASAANFYVSPSTDYGTGYAPAFPQIGFRAVGGWDYQDASTAGWTGAFNANISVGDGTGRDIMTTGTLQPGLYLCTGAVTIEGGTGAGLTNHYQITQGSGTFSTNLIGGKFNNPTATEVQNFVTCSFSSLILVTGAGTFNLDVSTQAGSGGCTVQALSLSTYYVTYMNWLRIA